MNFWIINQNRNKLVKINDVIYLDEIRKKITVHIGEKIITLGEYETLERAKDIFEDVCQFPSFNDEYFEGKNRKNMTYEMPEK